MNSRQPQAILSYGQVLSASLNPSTLPYPALKALLRALKKRHPGYPPRLSGVGPVCSLSQTQKEENDSGEAMEDCGSGERQGPRRESSEKVVTSQGGVAEEWRVGEVRGGGTKRMRLGRGEGGEWSGGAVNDVIWTLAMEKAGDVTWGEVLDAIKADGGWVDEAGRRCGKGFELDDLVAVAGGGEVCVFYSDRFWEDYACNTPLD